MRLEAITPEAVRDALRAIRYDKPQAASPLAAMDTVTLMLRQHDVPDGRHTPALRAWGLGLVLQHHVEQALGELRDPNERTSLRDLTPEREARLLAADFAAGHREREVWGYLHARYLSPVRAPVQTMTEIAGVAEKTLERRLRRGHRLLADQLRVAEAAAAPSAGRAPGMPAHDRIVVTPDASELSASATDSTDEDGDNGRPLSHDHRQLLDAIRDESRIVHVAESVLRTIAQGPVPDLDAYRLSRVAAWSLPRYRLDERFVSLRTLVDQGEDASSGRWRVSARRFDSLHEVLEAIAQPTFVLLGAPGGGKSTLLRRLELDVAIAGLRGATDRVTLFAPLNLYRSADATDDVQAPIDWLAERWRARAPGLPPLEQLLDEGRMLLLLDALNEIPHVDADDYGRLVQSWKQLCHRIVDAARGNIVLFSCRSLDYSASLSTPELRVPQVEIEPMDDARVRGFLRAYAPKHAASMWNELRGTPQLELFRTPYYLRLLIDQLEATGRVVAGRAGLFTGFVRQALRREIERDHPLFVRGPLLGERDRRQVIGTGRWPSPYTLPGQGKLIRGLESLAHGMQRSMTGRDGSQVAVDYQDAAAMVDEPHSDALLRAAIALAILDEDDRGSAVQFFHQLLQEYFAARRLAREPDPALVAVPWRIADMDPPLGDLVAQLSPADALPPAPATVWSETAVLAAPMASEPAAFVERLAAANLPLAGFAAAQPDVLRRLDAEHLHALRGRLAERSRDVDADLRARMAAADALGRLGDARYERHQGPHGSFLVPPMVSIPSGTYNMGSDCHAPDGPRHNVRLGAFAIGRYPVTNAEWKCFQQAGGYEDERWWDTEDARAWRQGQGTAEGGRSSYRAWRRRLRDDPELLEEKFRQGQVPRPLYEDWAARLRMSDQEFEEHLADRWPEGRKAEPEWWPDTAFNQPLQPVVGVSWYEARAYCAWLSACTGDPCDLVSEAEWEAAVPGVGETGIRDGADLDPLAFNNALTHVQRPSPVGVFPGSDASTGLADGLGNIHEWTRSLFGCQEDGPTWRYPYRPDDGREDPHAGADVRRVKRGGGWADRPEEVRTTQRLGDIPAHRANDAGFRIVVRSA